MAFGFPRHEIPKELADRRFCGQKALLESYRKKELIELLYSMNPQTCVCEFNEVGKLFFNSFPWNPTVLLLRAKLVSRRTKQVSVHPLPSAAMAGNRVVPFYEARPS